MEHPENSEEYKGLTVNKGIEQPSIVNPYLKLRKKPRRREFSVGEYVEGIVKGDVTVLSQAVTLVESVKPEHQAIAQEVIEKCLPYSGNSMRIGISGVPGAGKVPLLMYLACMYWRNTAASWPFLPLTRAVNAAKAVFSVIRRVWRSSPFIPSPLYVPVPLPVRWVAWHARRVKRLCFVRLPVSTRYL